MLRRHRHRNRRLAGIEERLRRHGGACVRLVLVELTNLSASGVVEVIQLEVMVPIISRRRRRRRAGSRSGPRVAGGARPQPRGARPAGRHRPPGRQRPPHPFELTVEGRIVAGSRRRGLYPGRRSRSRAARGRGSHSARTLSTRRPHRCCEHALGTLRPYASAARRAPALRARRTAALRSSRRSVWNLRRHLPRRADPWRAERRRGARHAVGARRPGPARRSRGPHARRARRPRGHDPVRARG